MARFLVTMLPANDLGLPTRMVPIACALAARGHEVAVFNPAPAPGRLIAEAGLTSLPMPVRPMPAPAFDLMQVSEAWDVEHFFGGIYTSEAYVREALPVYLDLVRDYAPDAIVDSFDPLACLAARIQKVPLVTVLQGNFHPASRGFKWWENERPSGLSSGTAHVNKVIAEYGLAPLDRCIDVMAGDLSLIVGTPETDPVDEGANVTHIGPMVFQSGDAALPAWVNEISSERPLIWVYPGNPRYAPVATPIDSIVVIRAAIDALANEPLEVVLTTGYQELPQELGTLPANFRHVDYVPGLLMAERCDLIVFHGGHSSVMTTLKAGTPAVIIPTITERESNARRLASLGAGEVVMPVSGPDGEKRIDVAEFGTKVKRVLNEPAYRQSAKRVSESMRRFGGAQAAAERIENLVFAR
jgi:MGT family glycosyltransferase